MEKIAFIILIIIAVLAIIGLLLVKPTLTGRTATVADNQRSNARGEQKWFACQTLNHIGRAPRN